MARPRSAEPRSLEGIPPTPTRRGACPALDAPMQTGDGLLLRLSPESGGVSPNQLIALCDSAARNGNGMVEVTARGSLQFRGFDADSAARFAEDVAAVGVAVRTGVPVEVGPLAGLDATEIADPRPVAEAIRAGIEAARLHGRLGPKVSVVVDGGGAVSLDGIAADVRLTAERREECVVWRLAIAGDAASAVHLGQVGAAKAVEAALTLLEHIAVLGSDARGRDLTSEPRLATLGSTLPLSGLPAISPTGGEIGSFDDAALSATSTIGEAQAAGSISPLVGGPKDGRDPWLDPESGRTERGNVGRNPASPQNNLASDGDGSWTHPLQNRHLALRIALPFGSMTAKPLIRLAETAQTFGIADIRPAPMRSLLPICPDTATAEALRTMTAELGFITGEDIRTTMAACPGAPACASGRIAARRVAEEVAGLLGDDAARLPSIHVSGCAKGCARPAPAAITVVGVDSGAALVVDGTSRAKPLAYRSGDGLSEAVAAAARAYRRETCARGLPETALAHIAAAFGERHR